MKFLPLLLLLACGANKTRMTGYIASDEIYFDGWVAVKVNNVPTNPTMWIQLDKKQISEFRKGSDVVFYVQLKEVTR